jgi:hypothetical protein
VICEDDDAVAADADFDFFWWCFCRLFRQFSTSSW